MSLPDPDVVFFVVVNEDLNVVYRGSDEDTCIEYLRPGKMVGNIFGKHADPLEAESMARFKMQECLELQRADQRRKAASA